MCKSIKPNEMVSFETLVCFEGDEGHSVYLYIGTFHPDRIFGFGGEAEPIVISLKIDRPDEMDYVGKAYRGGFSPRQHKEV